jgi:hypothetical protein
MKKENITSRAYKQFRNSIKEEILTNEYDEKETMDIFRMFKLICEIMEFTKE